MTEDGKVGTRATRRPPHTGRKTFDYEPSWPGVTVHLDPDTKRATIRNAHTGKATDLPLRRLSVDSAETTILTRCKEN